MDKSITDWINRILAQAQTQDWEHQQFSLEKAQVCAELCALVYNELRPYELKRASRIHLFASEQFRRLQQAGQVRHILPSINENNREASAIVVANRYAITLVIKMGTVIFIAIRGTIFSKLWDWKFNVDTRKYYVPQRGYVSKCKNVFFHRGFFEAIAPQLRAIGHALSQLDRKEETRTVVLTGHSLGGAMAAVAKAFGIDIPLGGAAFRHMGNCNAYTFGMPRYASAGAVFEYDGPYHVLRPQDLVPKLPTRRMGFFDSANEYIVSDKGSIEATERTDIFDAWDHLFSIRASLEAHSIEGYADSIANALGSQRLNVSSDTSTSPSRRFEKLTQDN